MLILVIVERWNLLSQLTKNSIQDIMVIYDYKENRMLANVISFLENIVNAANDALYSYVLIILLVLGGLLYRRRSMAGKEEAV